MRIRYALYVVGLLVVVLGLTMLIPLGFSLYYGDAGTVPLLLSIGVSLAAGSILALAFRAPDIQAMNHREGMASVALGWCAGGVVGSLPLYFSGTFDTWIDALFESVSGFTTTGASMLTDVEVVPNGLLMWRSLTHLFGGLGIIAFSLAILPFLGVGGMQMYKAEATGPVKDKLKPRIKDTALALWKVYLLITVVLIILLMLGGMNLFDAMCHAFGTVGTGGFSTKNASIGYYHSAYLDWVITLFMFLCGANFSLHYRAVTGRPMDLLRDSEFRFYLCIACLFTLLVFFSVWKIEYASPLEALRHAAFQVVSIMTTTGYVTQNFELWPMLPQFLLVLLMFLGSSCGSTGGGMKSMRILLIIKHVHQEFIRLIHPRAVQHVKLEGKIVPPEVLSAIWGFFLLYMGLFVVSSGIMAALGVDLATALTSVASCLGNVGPGLGTVGPVDNYSHLPALGKWVLTFDMLLGRLEIYTVAILFIPEFWRK